jgi:hypothetical protein
LATAVLFSGTAFAVQSSEEKGAKGTVIVRTDAQLGDTAVPAGKYSAEIVPGDEPVLVLTRNGKEVARAAVERRETPVAMPYDQIRIGLTATGTSEVVAVTFKGRRDTFTVRSVSQIANSTKP